MGEAVAVVEVVPSSLPVSAGLSQCQWSPCGSQPVDSVGLGIVGEAEAVVEIVSSLAVDVIEEIAVEAGPSQCLYRDVLLDILVQCSRWEQTNGLRVAHSRLKQ